MIKKGVQDAIPIAMGYIPVAIAYGVLGHNQGIPAVIIIFMSLIVFAGASQFIGIQLMALGVSGIEIIITTFIVNIRHLLMSATLENRFDTNLSNIKRSIIAFGITDETFSVLYLSNNEKILSAEYTIALNTTAYLAWFTGTVTGILLASALPTAINDAMGIALYAMFIALLIPAVKTQIKALVIVGFSVLFHVALRSLEFIPELSIGLSVVIASVLAALIGMLIFPEGINGDEKWK
jgi:4-azaleucine resistance transporter AzlC